MGLLSFAKGLKQSKEEFIVKVQFDAVETLKVKLNESGKDAVRLKVKGFGWGGLIVDIVLDEQRDNDMIYEIEGIKFVADSSLKSAVAKPELVKIGSEVKVKSKGCC